MLSGSPVAFMIRNTSQHSSDYNNFAISLAHLMRDFTARMRYGDKVDMREAVTSQHALQHHFA